MIIPLEEDFSDITKFDLDVVSKLSKYFDLDYMRKDFTEYLIWFTNLSNLARQNLGLAHSVLHNQSARNAINIAYHQTGLDIFKKSYESNIGTYSFFKGLSKFLPDTMILDNDHISGTKYWASNIDTANFVIVNIMGPEKALNIKPYIVYIDLTQVEHKIIMGRTSPYGMHVAMPGDLLIDNAKIPKEWNLQPSSGYREIMLFHYYGIIVNYISIANELLSEAKKQEFPLYDLKKIELDVLIAQLLQDKTLISLVNPIEEYLYGEINTRWQFARKTLINVIAFFMETMNSMHHDTESVHSQKFKDAIIMAAHVVNLYKHLSYDPRW